MCHHTFSGNFSKLRFQYGLVHSKDLSQRESKQKDSQCSGNLAAVRLKLGTGTRGRVPVARLWLSLKLSSKSRIESLPNPGSDRAIVDSKS